MYKRNVREFFRGNLWEIFMGNVGKCFVILWRGNFPGEFVKKVNALGTSWG